MGGNPEFLFCAPLSGLWERGESEKERTDLGGRLRGLFCECIDGASDKDEPKEYGCGSHG